MAEVHLHAYLYEGDSSSEKSGQKRWFALARDPKSNEVTQIFMSNDGGESWVEMAAKDVRKETGRYNEIWYTIFAILPDSTPYKVVRLDWSPPIVLTVRPPQVKTHHFERFNCRYDNGEAVLRNATLLSAEQRAEIDRIPLSSLEVPAPPY